MKKAGIFLIIALGIISCKPIALYNWGIYEQLTYVNYSKQTPESVCKMIAMYESLVKTPGGSKKMPPPGICAEYGYLLLLPETATTFMEHATKKQRAIFKSTDYPIFFHEYGLEMMSKEMKYYPESGKFIKPLLERFSKK